MTNLSLTLQPIALIHTPYKEKFAIPRQANLVQDGTGIIELLPPYNIPESVRGLEQFSHIWLIFQFNQVPTGKWQATVRPPRLGGNQRIGVFASRATHRPNPLGLSKVALEKIECKNGKVLLYVGSVDLVDGTPIFDIKPYVSYADNEVNAQSGFAQEKPDTMLTVEFQPLALSQIEKLSQKIPHLLRFIQEVIQQDPRPAYQKNKVDQRIYGMTLHNINIRWKIKSNNKNIAEVLDLTEI
ncbi:tRNA-Thr(GGU) m(6)t(6)A37 methyltransferase TsaA [Bisgaardia hudsonensis]|uniref:tRNA-Thr(GGU) m(6)t(6)A37 methyltransferase TsaA n=1 Tax=Bisgaardia hudsonensis TaxID=109472 RepID=A0A4R2MXH7_9PAST|nr:tRNA (N6-threonylcarbamoyladenosine(37)-N6)-methyltransferase TrmO [Bisgaardia hudsonensis]QLB12340.1 tRNA-Thr(GGU) m(6)t(6)A37 methyltransferase TsaA [Bisgaardia hudsonensis]TCP12387.1 tRNA-Thr(GGU) m(6)t(6)A37 methyltransferase TsaA [Bisgaardia hudsonensis]